MKRMRCTIRSLHKSAAENRKDSVKPQKKDEKSPHF
jgi:hypothetical protein